MITDAVNTEGKSVFDYPSWAARLSTNELPPTLEEEVSHDIIPLRVLQSAGGQELDSAEYQWRLSGDLINRTQPAAFTRMMDVLLPTEGNHRVHLGDLVTEHEKCNADGDQLTTESHLRPYHFGLPLDGERWWNPLTSSSQVVQKDITFNPNIDGQTLGNMSDQTPDNELNHFWIHPEAALTKNAESYLTQTAAKWTLKDAIIAVCAECNPTSSGQHIKNPNPFALDTVFNNAIDLEAVTLPRGQYLPTYLDSLLHPHGFNWYVQYYVPGFAQPEWDKFKPEIIIFKKGVGTTKQLYYQKPGEEYDAEHTNLNAYSVNRTIGDLHNAVRVVGDYERREVTLDLHPAWPESGDEYTATDLARKDGSAYKENQTAYRLWVANEAGDITGLRTKNRPAGDPPKFEGVFTVYVPHRRKIEPPLTYVGEEGDKTRRDISLEVKPEGSVEYHEYTGTFAVLPDQIGVLLSDNELPDEVMGQASFRITGTVTGDYRITGVANRKEYSVNGREVWLELDRPQKFVNRQVATSVLPQEAGADTRDDTDAIQAYAEKLRNETGHAEMDCQFTLPGFHLHYEIGDLLSNIAGREISLDQASSEDETAVYCQITKREFVQDLDSGPMTILTVDRGVRIVEDTPE